MPNAQEIEERALEYGSLVSNIREKKIQLRDIEDKTVEAAEKLEKLKSEIEQNKDANDRVRMALLDEEKRLEEMKKQKVDELQTERTIVEAQRRENAEKTAELNTVADSLDTRGHRLTGLEKKITADREEMDREKEKIQKDSIDLENAKKDLELRETSLNIQKKSLEQQSIELDKKIGENRKIESDGKAALERARAEAKEASDSRLKEQAHLHEAQQFAQSRTEAERQLRLLLPVFYDVRDFIKNHLKNPDQIENYVSIKFPAVAALPPQSDVL